MAVTQQCIGQYNHVLPEHTQHVLLLRLSKLKYLLASDALSETMSHMFLPKHICEHFQMQVTCNYR